jgi:hypothetical protein
VCAWFIWSCSCFFPRRYALDLRFVSHFFWGLTYVSLQKFCARAWACVCVLHRLCFSRDVICRESWEQQQKSKLDMLRRLRDVLGFRNENERKHTQENDNAENECAYDENELYGGNGDFLTCFHTVLCRRLPSRFFAHNPFIVSTCAHAPKTPRCDVMTVLAPRLPLSPASHPHLYPRHHHPHP